MKCNLLFLLLFPFIQSFSQTSQYHALKTIQIGDGLGWDYLTVDQQNRNMYISHATNVQIVSVDKDAVIGVIPNTFGVHGIAIDNKHNRGFISNGKANSVTVFNLKNFIVTDTIAINGVNPDAILYDGFSQKVFAFNGKTNNATIINAITLKVIGNIVLSGKPEFAVSDQTGKIYVNIEDKSQLLQIDATSFKVLKTWSVMPGEEPSGLAIDRKNNLLFSVCSNKKLIVFDIKQEKIIDSLPIGGRVDAVVFDPQTKLIYTSNGEGNVTIIQQISPTNYKVVQTMNTQKGCKTMALDSKTKKIYLPAAQFEGDTKKVLPGSFEILVYQ